MQTVNIYQICISTKSGRYLLTMGLNILDDMLETTSIQFVGHEIKFDLRTAESETKV